MVDSWLLLLCANQKLNELNLQSQQVKWLFDRYPVSLLEVYDINIKRPFVIPTQVDIDGLCALFLQSPSDRQYESYESPQDKHAWLG